MYLDFAEMKMHMVSAYFDFTILVQKLIQFLFQANLSNSVDVMEQKMHEFESKLANVTSGTSNSTGLQNQIVRHFIDLLLWIHCFSIFSSSQDALRSETANNFTNLEGHVDARVSVTEQNISSNSIQILNLKQNDYDIGMDIMNLNYSFIGLDHDVSMKLNTLNTTQVSIQSVIPCQSMSSL